MKTRALTLAFATLLALFAACGGESHDEHNEGASAPADPEEISFGAPAEESEADREIEVEATDSLRFDPESIEVGKGETIAFIVTNTGSLEHEFVLGDPHFQEDHAEGAAGHGDHGSSGNSVHVPPGETETITWTFSQDLEVQYACHVDNHFEAGMVGSVDVSS